MYNRCDNCIYCAAILRTIEQLYSFFSTFRHLKSLAFLESDWMHSRPICCTILLFEGKKTGPKLQVNFVVRKFNGLIACQNISKEMDTKKILIDFILLFLLLLMGFELLFGSTTISFFALN